jgi:mono/diheme cytochrome c family protein
MKSVAYSLLAFSLLVPAILTAEETDIDANKNPVAADKDSLSKGQRSYMDICAVCHGKKGDGNGPSAESFGVPPWSFTDGTIDDFSDGYLFQKIKNGGVWYEMPPFGFVLKEREIWDLVNYLRFLQKKS